MSGFISQWDFQRFCQSVLERFRYIHEREVDIFLDAVNETARSRVVVVEPKRSLWRAQIGCDSIPLENNDGVVFGEREVAYGKDRMKPIPFQQNPGRLNAAGTNCLYLAIGEDSDAAKKTAIAEVRPWVSAMVSVALFTNSEALHIVGCASDSYSRVWFGDSEPPEEAKEKIVWSQINWALARPVTVGDEPRDYIPTQIIAELFRSKGYDGVVYKSSLGAGRNFALFDFEAAEFKDSELHQVDKVNYETSPWG